MVRVIVVSAAVNSYTVPAVNDIQVVFLIANKTCSVSMACINSTCYMYTLESDAIVAIAERCPVIALRSQVESHGVTITIEGSSKGVVFAGSYCCSNIDIGSKLIILVAISGVLIVNPISKGLPVDIATNLIRIVGSTATIKRSAYFESNNLGTSVRTLTGNSQSVFTNLLYGRW